MAGAVLSHARVSSRIGHVLPNRGGRLQQQLTPKGTPSKIAEATSSKELLTPPQEIDTDRAVFERIGRYSNGYRQWCSPPMRFASQTDSIIRQFILFQFLPYHVFILLKPLGQGVNLS